MPKIYNDLRILDSKLDLMGINPRGAAVQISVTIGKYYLKYETIRSVHLLQKSKLEMHNMRIRYNPRDLRKIHLFTRRNDQFVCTLYQTYRERVCF